MKKVLCLLLALICTQAYSQKKLDSQKGEYYLFSYNLDKAIENSKTYCVGKPQCNTVWKQNLKNKSLRVEPDKGDIRSVFELPELNLKNVVGDKLHLEFNQNNHLGEGARIFIEVEDNFGKIIKYTPTGKPYQLINISKSKTAKTTSLRIRYVVETLPFFKCIRRPCYYEIIDFSNCIVCCGGTNGQRDPIAPPK